MFFFGSSWFTILYYLQIYFQVVSGVSACQNGIRNLPFIISVVVVTIVSSGLIFVNDILAPHYRYDVDPGRESDLHSGLLQNYHS